MPITMERMVALCEAAESFFKTLESIRDQALALRDRVEIAQARDLAASSHVAPNDPLYEAYRLMVKTHDSTLRSLISFNFDPSYMATLIREKLYFQEYGNRIKRNRIAVMRNRQRKDSMLGIERQARPRKSIEDEASVIDRDALKHEATLREQNPNQRARQEEVYIAAKRKEAQFKGIAFDPYSIQRGISPKRFQKLLQELEAEKDAPAPASTPASASGLDPETEERLRRVALGEKDASEEDWTDLTTLEEDEDDPAIDSKEHPFL